MSGVRYRRPTSPTRVFGARTGSRISTVSVGLNKYALVLCPEPPSQKLPTLMHILFPRTLVFVTGKEELGIKNKEKSIFRLLGKKVVLDPNKPECKKNSIS